MAHWGTTGNDPHDCAKLGHRWASAPEAIELSSPPTPVGYPGGEDVHPRHHTSQEGTGDTQQIYKAHHVRKINYETKGSRANSKITTHPF